MEAIRTPTQHGYLVLADISGYTPFMAGTELEHSHEIMSELLELIVSRLTPVLTLADLEGDAVFAFAPEARLLRGETLLELVEATYVAFKERLKNVRRNTTCECRACLTAHTLDLKFIVHYGEYLARRAAGGYELTSLDANLVRQRLLKNAVSETGWHGYVVFTERCMARMRVRPEGGRAQTAAYEHMGEVGTYSLDLQARYQELAEARRVFVGPDEADFVFTHDFPAPPPVVWEWLNEPEKRMRWQRGRTWRVGLRPGGRTGPGARNHCAHSAGQLLETILDWRPFDYFTIETAQSPLVLTATLRLEPLPAGGGTRVQTCFRAQRPRLGPFTRPLIKMAVEAMRLPKAYGALARLIAAETPREEEAPTSSSAAR